MSHKRTQTTQDVKINYRNASTTARKEFTARLVPFHNFTLQENTMRTLRKSLVASVLILMLVLSATAGEISTGVAPPQPAPTPATAEMSTTFNGDIHTTSSDEATAGDAVVAGALGVLQGVLSLL